jgi:hypothetical protein
MQNDNTWLTHSRMVISGLLNADSIGFGKILFEQALNSDDLCPDEENLGYMLSIIRDALYPTGLPFTSENIAAESNGKITPFTVSGLRKMNVSVDQALSSARYVKGYANRERRLRQIADAQRQLQDGKLNPDEVAINLVMQLTSTSSQMIQSPRMGDIIRREKERRTAEILPISTMLHSGWLNKALNGALKAARFIGIAGAEKQRKSTLLRNIILQACRISEGRTDGIPRFTPNNKVVVALMAFENDQRITTYDFMAMLAFEWLYYHEKHKIVAGGMALGDYCDGETMEELYLSGEWEKIDSAFKRAVQYAEGFCSEMEIYIYDRRPGNGGLRSFKDYRRCYEMFLALHPDRNIHKIICVDYAQLVMNSNDIYKDLLEFSLDAVDLAISREVTVIALSQLNQEYKKTSKEMAAADVLGTKGGGSLGEGVHNYLETKYDQDAPDTLTVRLRRARRTSAGKDMFCDYKIHAKSGLILEDKNGSLYPGEPF